uniref:Uncharacterized protein n=1 Tax=Anguilla anguilla TaxID=7936 RepID=A0A0E9XHI5_ANGAN
MSSALKASPLGNTFFRMSSTRLSLSLSLNQLTFTIQCEMDSFACFVASQTGRTPILPFLKRQR